MSNENKPLTAEEVLRKHLGENTGYYEFGIEDVLPAMEHYAAQLTTALREELDKVKRELDHQKAENTVLQQQHERELEAEKKERSELKEKHITDYSNLVETIAKFQAQRDEAVKLMSSELPILMEAFEDAPVDFQGTASHDTSAEEKEWYTKWQSCIERLQLGIVRLSSGETKPVSPWISVEDQIPEVGQTVAFIVSSNDEHNNGRILGGSYDGFKFGYHGFSTPGIGWSGSHWMPLPAPPESSNQNEQK